MIVLSLLFLASLVGIFAALTLPDMLDLLLLAGPCAIASLILWVRAFVHRAKTGAKWIVVDGSNVMYWKDNTPQIDTVREVLGHLYAHGFTPGIMFDANAGYLLSGKYKHDGALAKLLGLPTNRVMVVSKGTPADPAILAAARDLGARVVTNDKFRDWAETYPEVHKPGHLIPGAYRAGELWLDLNERA